MNDSNMKKGNTVLLTIIAVATLLVAVVGATFAYFTASVQGTEKASSIVVNTAQIGTITYNEGNELNLDSALPGDTLTKTFTIEAAQDSTTPIKYTVKLVNVINSISNNELEYTLRGVEQQKGTTPGSVISGTSGEEVQSHTIEIFDSASSSSNSINLGTGTLGTNGEKHSYTLEIHFKETGSEQNSNQKQSFTGKIEVTTGDDEGNEYYYTSGHSEGTTSKPSSETTE